MPYYNLQRNALTDLPSRVRVAIVGGGIHGVGLSHDLASRGWTDTLVLDKSTLGSGTSSWSTKLIHGGLRYLQHPSQIGMVREALKERALLMQLAGDIITPLPFIYPIVKKSTGKGRSYWQVRSGLWLYDRLAGKHGIQRHRPLSVGDMQGAMPGFKCELFARGLEFWDGQTDDLALVLRVASSAVHLGAHLAENVYVQQIVPTDDGFRLRIENVHGHPHDIHALYVVLATGPWSHELMQRSHIPPAATAIKNKGVHLLLPDLGLKKACFFECLYSQDGRIFFVIPWQNHTLVGTTETLYREPADEQKPLPSDQEYLLSNLNIYRSEQLTEQDILYTYSGLRWLPRQSHKVLSALSRESLITTHGFKKGALFTIYGGKLTGYRLLSQKLGDQILAAAGDDTPSTTHDQTQWVQKDQMLKTLPPIHTRFIPHGPSHISSP